MIKQSDLSKIKNLPADTNGALNGKSNNGHTHDDRYYTESEAHNLFVQSTAIRLENQDFNKIVKGGFYATVQNNTNNHAPINQDGRLLVLPWNDGGWASQVFFADDGRIFTRTSNNFAASAWKDWTETYTRLSKPTPNEIGALRVDGKAVDSEKLRGWLIAGESNNYAGVPVVAHDSVMEIGKYIDFHIPGNKKDFDVRLEAGTDGKLYCYPGFVGDDFYANKYLRIRDWYGAATDGRIYFKSDGRQMITEDVEVFESKKLKAKEGGITSEGPIYAWRANITTDKDLVFGGKCLSTIQSGGANLYCEGRGGGTHGWHFADVNGQYADIYARVYRQQSDSRTKQEIPKLNTLNFLQLGKPVVEEKFIDKISRVQTKNYFYYNDSEKKPIFGFFAQDLEKEFPQTVNTMHYTQEQIESGEIIFPKDKEGNDIHDLKTIDPIAVSAVMWNSIQELNEELKKCKKQLSDNAETLKTYDEELKKALKIIEELKNK